MNSEFLAEHLPRAHHFLERPIQGAVASAIRTNGNAEARSPEAFTMALNIASQTVRCTTPGRAVSNMARKPSSPTCVDFSSRAISSALCSAATPSIR
jgi:hypothetical protein